MLRKGYEIRKVVVATGYTDLRWGIDSLSARVRLNYGLNPLEKGTLFLFMGRRRDRIKGLLFEGSGFTLVYHRLINGRFQWPLNENEALSLDMEMFARLMDGHSVVPTINVPKCDGPDTHAGK